MRIDKKFINLDKSKVIVIPHDWIKSREAEVGKTMFGVYIDVNDDLKITPMWEDENEKL